jgi:uncharacterized membrane protein (UPF0127 family)
VRRLSDGAVVCEQLTLGTSFGQRFMGLMGRASMAAGEGLFLPDTSIHMMFMRFPIDALFVGPEGPDGSRDVVAIREDLPPWRGLVLPVRGARGVVELPAGTLATHGLQPGDRVVFDAGVENGAAHA